MMTEPLTTNEPVLACVEGTSDSENPFNAQLNDNKQCKNDSTHDSENTSSKPLQEVQNQSKSSELVSTPGTFTSPNVSNHSNAGSQLSAEQQLLRSKRELESMVLRYAKSERENLDNKNKIEELDKKLQRSIKDNNQLANRNRLLTNDKNHLTDTLNAKVAQLTVLEQKNLYLNNVQGVRLNECEAKIKKLESLNEDLLKQIESYKSKEGELLDFSERLSMKHMILQSELDEALNKVPNYKERYEEVLGQKENLIQQGKELSKHIKILTANLNKEQECSDLLRKERDEDEVKFQYKLEELQNELKFTRRKHQLAIKELVREIKQLRSRLEKVAPTTQDVAT